MILNATGAVYYFYALLFAMAFFTLFYGIIKLYKEVQNNDNEGIRRAKFILLLSVIAMLCIAVVSFFITGNIPIY
ncbi:MAG: hypothetical protein KGK14_08055 [Bacteroidota bacterium]|jgi:hypothetical protein|nr:hypothetical protein [Bacteroidota bacterium]